MCKKIFLVLPLVLLSAVMAQAQYTTDGYYRVQNVSTSRYIVVLDDKGSLDVATTDADLGALKTFSGFDAVVSTPGSIIYIEKKGSSGYVLYSQGTDTYSIVSVYLKLLDNKDGSYKAYASKNSMVKYLVDQSGNYNPGTISTGSKTSATSNWYILPVNNTDENQYFGITPECTVGSDHYTTFYASFPFSFASDGMAAYYVSKVGVANDGFGMAVWKEVTATSVPASTPVIVKCSSTDPASNRLDLLSSSSTSISGNQLIGRYFCNDVRLTHRNVLEYDPATMRVLGLTSDGSLGFIKVDTETLTYIPANTAYLSVSEDCPDELKLVTESEYEQLLVEHENVDTSGGDDNTGDENVENGDDNKGDDNVENGDDNKGDD
ncbi:MAG: hypothetical protein LUC44_05120, partial [Prevotellaceae bacterium]|nr:hypothetical protein [Prevotellaceae bacterium]